MLKKLRYVSFDPIIPLLKTSSKKMSIYVHKYVITSIFIVLMPVIAKEHQVKLWVELCLQKYVEALILSTSECHFI